MRRWVPGKKAVGLLHVASWAGFVIFVLLAVLLETGLLSLPSGVIFICFSFVFLIFWPAMSIVATRTISGKPPNPLNWLDTWKVIFAGVPAPLAIFVVLYFYAVVGWLLLAGVFRRSAAGHPGDLGPSAVGLLALPSIFALVAAAIFFGYLHDVQGVATVTGQEDE
jgi:hypothetical protein